MTLLEAAHAAGGGAAHHLHLPAAGFRKARIHPEEVFGEEPRLVASRAGPDLEKDVLLVVRVLRQEQDLESLLQVFQRLLQLGQFLLGQFPQPFVAVPEQFLILLDMAAGSLVLAEGLHQGAEIGMLLGVFLIDPLLADDGRIAEELLQFQIARFYVFEFFE